MRHYEIEQRFYRALSANKLNTCSRILRGFVPQTAVECWAKSKMKADLDWIRGTYEDYSSGVTTHNHVQELLSRQG